MSARRYIVVVQAAEGYPARHPSDEEPPCPPHPVIHTAVLADDYEAVEKERDRYRRALRHIATYGSNEGDLRDAPMWEQAMRNIANNATEPPSLPTEPTP